MASELVNNSSVEYLKMEIIDHEHNNPPVGYFKTEIIDNEQIKDDSLEDLDLCDASTIVNVSLFNKQEKNIVGKCNQESEIKILDNGTVSDNIPQENPTAQEDPKIQERSDQTVDHVKVVDWLEQSQFQSSEGAYDLEVTECFLTADWLDKNSPYLTNTWRTRVFLLDVEPSSDHELLDLVSGYCSDGCKKFCTYSTVVWWQEDKNDIPMCPNCEDTEIKKELKLMFKFKLNVLDTNGRHTYINVWRENAEEFLGCLTEDFLHKPSVREAVVMPLRRYCLANTVNDRWSPLLDMNVVCVKDSYFVVRSSLKDARKCRKEPWFVDLTKSTQVHCKPAANN